MLFHNINHLRHMINRGIDLRGALPIDFPCPGLAEKIEEIYRKEGAKVLALEVTPNGIRVVTTGLPEELVLVQEEKN